MIKEERRRRKKRKIQLYIFLTITLLLALAAFIVVEVFTVERVEVEGNEWYSASQIEEMVLNDEYSWNSLYVTLKYRFVEIGEVPFIDEMEVSLDDPHTLRIKVYEKGILGYLYIPVLGQNVYFDKDGFVVETSTNLIPNVPKVIGIECNEVVLYEKLPLEDESILRLLLNLTQTLEKYDVQPDEIAFDDGDGALVYYDNIRVIVGEEEYLPQKIKRLKEKYLPTAQEIIREEGLVGGTLHLDKWTEETRFATFTKGEKVQNP